MKLPPRRQYDRKIALQAKHFFVKEPTMPRGFFNAQAREMAAYKRVSAKWNLVNCKCDALKAAHEEKYGYNQYPHFQCQCGRSALHSVLVKRVEVVNARHRRLWAKQNEGVLAHIKRGAQAYEAKKKWIEQSK